VTDRGDSAGHSASLPSEDDFHPLPPEDASLDDSVLSGLGSCLKGVFITFEGLDGCGKSTQMEMLAEGLADKGYVITVTREPGGTPLGEGIRSMLLDPMHHGMSARAEALLYAAARAHLVKEVIRPALEDGHIVLCDRYIDSSLAYQGYGRGLGTDYIMLVNDWGTEGLYPDLTLFLDLDDSVRATRLGAVPDRLEAEDEAFHQRVLKGFRELLLLHPHRIRRVDAGGDSAAVQERVRAIIEQELELFSH
jgi:dTMP kinase